MSDARFARVSKDMMPPPDFIALPRLSEHSLFSLEFWKSLRKEGGSGGRERV
jgi:hypothetical protein